MISAWWLIIAFLAGVVVGLWIAGIARNRDPVLYQKPHDIDRVG